MLSALSRILTSVVAAAIGGLVVFAMVGRQPAPEASRHAAPAGPREALVEVTEMPASARLKVGGSVEPRTTVRLSAQAPGRVTFVAGQEGERVGAGQLVVALDSDAITPEYRAAWSALSGEMADIENAQTQLYHNLYGPKTASPMGGPGYDAYERMAVPFYNMAQSFFGPMMPGGAGGAPLQTQAQAQRGMPAVNNARADYERRLAGLAGAQSRIDALDARLRDRRAIAPQAGVILKRHVRVGDVVQPGQPLADLADVDQLDVRIEVPATQIGSLHVGDQVPVTVEAQNLWAVVAQIFPAADSAQHTVTVKLALPAGAPVAAGMYAVAWIAQPQGGSPSALTPAVPTSAIAYRGSLPVAFAVDGQGVVEMRVLRLGDVLGDRTAVLSGLRRGDQVVADPSPHLKSGEAVIGGHP